MVIKNETERSSRTEKTVKTQEAFQTPDFQLSSNDSQKKTEKSRIQDGRDGDNKEETENGQIITDHWTPDLTSAQQIDTYNLEQVHLSGFQRAIF